MHWIVDWSIYRVTLTTYIRVISLENCSVHFWVEFYGINMKHDEPLQSRRALFQIAKVCKSKFYETFGYLKISKNELFCKHFSSFHRFNFHMLCEHLNFTLFTINIKIWNIHYAFIMHIMLKHIMYDADYT